jgi:hypothetical protein
VAIAARKGGESLAVLVERLEYEDIHLRVQDRIFAAKARPSRHVSRRNEQRPHRSLDTRMADHVYFTSLPLAEAAQPAGAPIETHPERLTNAAAAASSQTQSDERP